jgi:hypothetical protein
MPCRFRHQVPSKYLEPLFLPDYTVSYSIFTTVRTSDLVIVHWPKFPCNVIHKTSKSIYCVWQTCTNTRVRKKYFLLNKEYPPFLKVTIQSHPVIFMQDDWQRPWGQAVSTGHFQAVKETSCTMSYKYVLYPQIFRKTELIMALLIAITKGKANPVTGRGSL